MYLKNFGQVKVFRKSFKNETSRYYIMYVPEKDALLSISKADFEELHSIHWGIECYHRAIKQVCGIGKFMVSQCVGEAVRCVFSPRCSTCRRRAEESCNWRTRKGENN